jgi:hypothetical protein
MGSRSPEARLHDQRPADDRRYVDWRRRHFTAIEGDMVYAFGSRFLAIGPTGLPSLRLK